MILRVVLLAVIMTVATSFAAVILFPGSMIGLPAGWAIYILIAVATDVRGLAA